MKRATQAKLKEQESSRSGSSVAPRSRARAQTSSPDGSASIELWREELQELREKTYENLEEAIRAISLRVITRMGVAEAQQESTREFVEEFLLSDPTVCNVVSETLAIRHKK